MLVFGDAADVDVVDSDMSCDPHMPGSGIRRNHAIPAMTEAANIAYLMARRRPHKPPTFAAFAFVAVRLLLLVNLIEAKIPPLPIFPESRLRSKFTLCKGENRSLPLLLPSTVAIPGVASVEGWKLLSVCVELAVTTAALLLVLLILPQADDDASLADAIEASPRLVEGVLSAMPYPIQSGKLRHDDAPIIYLFVLVRLLRDACLRIIA